MSEKNNGKNRINKGVKGVRENKEKKGSKENKEEKGDKKPNSIDELLKKITTDKIIDAMVEHKWLVAKSISTYIIGVDIWDKLSEENKGIIIKRVNDVKLKNPVLMQMADINI